ncbi:ATP-binding protein [Thioclava sp. GXIMD4215]|uniref:ATP-binding protein n=1 Tax=Thioclava sp. GXIMD4215 TaxID=3131928 RepID=UPI00324F2A3C
MSFINLSAAGSISTLKAAHYSFPRADRLREDMVWMVTDYYAKASLRRPFEARGLLVTGPSRTGKSTEIRRQIDALNDGSTIMPDGRPARFVSVVLKGLLSWKDLGIHTLDQGLNYSATGRLTQREVWERVVIQAREQGVIGIHYDECQHIFPRVTGEARAMILDSFKSLLKQPEWPLMLILSGVDSLVQHITSEEQLAYLMRPISFPEVALHRPADLAEMVSLCHAYADKAGLAFDTLNTRDFYERLACACANRWGLVIELLIDAFVIALNQRASEPSPPHFCLAFTRRTGLREGYSPFSIDSYEALFSPQKIFEIWEKRRAAISA